MLPATRRHISAGACWRGSSWGGSPRRGRGAVVLTTCNRTEFYLAEPADATLTEIWKRSEIRIGAPANQYAYVLRDREVARHLFRVASGLDSLVVGESQIQGQVREAWEL